MQSSEERETRTYRRSSVICLICTAVCLACDIKRYISAGRIIFNAEFFVSLLLYALLVFLGIRAARKGWKGKGRDKR